MSDPIFQRGLQDLIKGIRSHKKDPSAFVSQSIVEIKSELRSTDPFIKAEAVSRVKFVPIIPVRMHKITFLGSKADLFANDWI